MKKLTKGLLIGLGSGLIVAGVIGVVGYFTSGFQNADKIVDLVKTGETVATFKYESSSWIDDNGNTLTLGFTNEIGDEEDEVKTLTDLKTTLRGFDRSNSQISSTWNKVSSLNDVYYTVNEMTFGLVSETDDDAVEFDYFDTVRICYRTPTMKFVALGSVGEELIEYKETVSILNNQYQWMDISVKGTDEMASVVTLITAGINGSADTRLTIESIELVAKQNHEADAHVYLTEDILTLAVAE